MLKVLLSLILSFIMLLPGVSYGASFPVVATTESQTVVSETNAKTNLKIDLNFKSNIDSLNYTMKLWISGLNSITEYNSTLSQGLNEISVYVEDIDSKEIPRNLIIELRPKYNSEFVYNNLFVSISKFQLNNTLQEFIHYPMNHPEFTVYYDSIKSEITKNLINKDKIIAGTTDLNDSFILFSLPIKEFTKLSSDSYQLDSSIDINFITKSYEFKESDFSLNVSESGEVVPTEPVIIVDSGVTGVEEPSTENVLPPPVDPVVLADSVRTPMADIKAISVILVFWLLLLYFVTKFDKKREK